MFSANTFYEYIMSYETSWNFISIVTRLRYGHYIGKVWNKYENEHRSNKTFSASNLCNNIYIFYATTFYLTSLDTYPVGPSLTLIICLKWLLVLVVVILISFTYMFAVSCNFYNINWQICFKFVVSHHSTKKFAKCFITHNKYNKDIKWLLAYTSFYNKYIFTVNIL